MGQMQWTYVDDYGRRFKVGLFHGDSTGHLMIYCNTRILVIDFHVIDTKKYSFFINDELCDIHVERLDDRFAYGFEFDHKTETPRNLKRRKRERQEMIRSFWVIGALLVVVGIVAFFMLGGIEYF